MSRMPLLKNQVVIRCECGCGRDVRMSLRGFRARKKVFFEKACSIRYNSEHPNKP